MPNYVTLDQVEKRLQGKVRFTTDEDDDNKMQESLALELIDEAEAEVEMRLSIRYEIPFQTTDGAAFDNLPTVTKNQIKAVVLSEAIKRVMMTDFGRGSVAGGEEYAKSAIKVAEETINRLIEIRDGQFNHFRYPPLPGLLLSAANEAADDGFAGRVLSTSDGYGSYAADQMNEPSETVFSRNPNNLEDLL